MQLLKSLGEGIGTAAGVAWPLFGIMFGVLGTTIGGPTAIVLGTILSGLFLLVAIPITYWSYNSYLEEKNKLQRQLDEQENVFCENIIHYLLSLTREHWFANKRNELNHLPPYLSVQEIKLWIVEDIKNRRMHCDHQLFLFLHNLLEDNKSEHFLHDYVRFLNSELDVTNDYCPVTSFESTKIAHLTQKLKQILPLNEFKSDNNPYTSLNYIRHGAVAFLAAFGSVAGCSAGLIGLLSCVGVFAGLSAVPILGWALLSTAIMFGLAVAAVSVCTVAANRLKRTLVEHYTKINHELKANTDYRNYKVDIEKELEKKYSSQQQSTNVIDLKHWQEFNKRKRPTFYHFNFNDKNHPIWKPDTCKLQTELVENVFIEPQKPFLIAPL